MRCGVTGWKVSLGVPAATEDFVAAWNAVVPYSVAIPPGLLGSRMYQTNTGMLSCILLLMLCLMMFVQLQGLLLVELIYDWLKHRVREVVDKLNEDRKRRRRAVHAAHVAAGQMTDSDSDVSKAPPSSSRSRAARTGRGDERQSAEGDSHSRLLHAASRTAHR